MEPFIYAPNLPIHFDYTNYKGEFEHRRVTVKYIYFGVNSYHGLIPKWFLVGMDNDKEQIRHFLMRDMVNVRILLEQ